MIGAISRRFLARARSILELIEPPVNTTLLQQFRVSAGLLQLSFVKGKDAAGRLNGGETMGNHDGGTAGKELLLGIPDA